MIKKIVIKNGKKYSVNAPGWDDGIGAGCPVGTLWMLSDDASWYAVQVSGSGGGADVYVDQTALTYVDNALGIQLVLCDNGNSYETYLLGTSPTVTFNVSQSAYSGSSPPKPYLFLESITDHNFYVVTLVDNVGTIEYSVSPTLVSGSYVKSVY